MWVDRIFALYAAECSDSPPGQRSIRLNRSYRAIYEVSANNSIEFVLIEEVNKHGY